MAACAKTFTGNKDCQQEPMVVHVVFDKLFVLITFPLLELMILLP
jgi:hypothetical protein